MAMQTMFMKIASPDIKGESQAADYKDQTQLHSCSFAGSNSAGFHGTSGLGAGTFRSNDLVVSAYVGGQSTQLLKHCFEGTHCGEITITFVKTGSGPKPLVLMTWTFKDCVISSYSVSASPASSDEMYMETFTIAYTSFEYKYNKQDATKGTTTLMNSVKIDLAQVQTVGA